MITKNTKIYIAGHKGMVGSAIWNKLKSYDYNNLIGKTSSELDLRNQKEVTNFYELEKPVVVIDAAAVVGGILANKKYPYEFLIQNLQIQNNLIDGAFKSGAEKFIFLGSSCIYPKFAKQPLKEEYLLSGSLEPTNEWYAIAKIAGVKACQSIKLQFDKEYLSLLPTNLYGYNDNFDLMTSHVLPAMIRKFHEAKEQKHTKVKLWGNGKAMREFLFVEDLAEAVIYALENKMTENIYNVGSGNDISIKALAKIVQKIIGHKGEIIWDDSMPIGTPRKVMDISKMQAVGWTSTTDLETGIKKTYEWFLKNINNLKEIKL